MTNRSPFGCFRTSPEINRLAVMRYIRFPLSLRNVEDLLHERGIEISHETVRYWWNRFGPIFASAIRGKRVGRPDRRQECRPAPAALDRGRRSGAIAEEVSQPLGLSEGYLAFLQGVCSDGIVKDWHLRHLPSQEPSPDPAARGLFR